MDDVSQAPAPEPPVTGIRPAATILALNSGSSSLKFGLYRTDAARTEVILSGEVESSGQSTSMLRAWDAQRTPLASETVAVLGEQETLAKIAALLTRTGYPLPTAVGHRVVHGGASLRQHCLIDDLVVRELAAAAGLAPLHTPAALAVIHAARAHFPGVPHGACFDTSFHANMPDVASVLPVAKALRAQGIQRYGFHGLSCASIVAQLTDPAPRRLIIAHLGNGASVTAINDGRSIDTSMGLTPSGGVIMGTRSGDLDPGVLLYLMREKRYDAALLEELLDQHSGLLGISGVASDMRQLRRAAESNADARLAIQMFCCSVAKQVAAMATTLDGVDLLVFTGGIGEHDAQIRATICRRLFCLGISLDVARNRDAHSPISDTASRCSVQVLASQEGEQIARHIRALIEPAAI